MLRISLFVCLLLFSKSVFAQEEHEQEIEQLVSLHHFSYISSGRYITVLHFAVFLEQLSFEILKDLRIQSFELEGSEDRNQTNYL